MDKETFYNKIAEILEINIEYKIPYSGSNRITRWNNRKPGNGRYPGYGLVHMYSETFIQVNFYNHKQMFNSTEDVLNFINTLVQDTKNII